jgi:hypothetical protein
VPRKVAIKTKCSGHGELRLRNEFLQRRESK